MQKLKKNTTKNITKNQKKPKKKLVKSDKKFLSDFTNLHGKKKNWKKKRFFPNRKFSKYNKYKSFKANKKFRKSDPLFKIKPKVSFSFNFIKLGVCKTFFFSKKS